MKKDPMRQQVGIPLSKTINPQPLVTKSQNVIRTLGLLNFLHFAALGLSAPFLSIYLREVGLTGTQIGILVSISAFLELSLTPLLNTMADRDGRHRWLFRLQYAFLIASHLSLAVFRLPLIVGGSFVLNSVNSRAANEMLSQLTITKLDEIKQGVFGRVRLWGSVGWAVTTLLSGSLIAIGSYPLLFLASAVVRASALPFTRLLPKETASADERTESSPRNPVVYTLMISQFLFWVGLNAVTTFLWIHFRENLGLAPGYIGFFAAIFALAEILPMLFIDRIIDRFGIRKVLLVGIFGMSVEFVLYALLPNAWWLIPLQLIRASAYTCFTIGITLIIARVSKPVNVSTNRALITVTMPALAMLLTSPLSGWIWDTYGALALFSFSTVMGLIATVFLLLNYDRLSSTEDNA